MKWSWIYLRLSDAFTASKTVRERLEEAFSPANKQFKEDAVRDYQNQKQIFRKKLSYLDGTISSPTKNKSSLNSSRMSQINTTETPRHFITEADKVIEMISPKGRNIILPPIQESQTDSARKEMMKMKMKVLSLTSR